MRAKQYVCFNNNRIMAKILLDQYIYPLPKEPVREEALLILFIHCVLLLPWFVVAVFSPFSSTWCPLWFRSHLAVEERLVALL